MLENKQSQKEHQGLEPHFIENNISVVFTLGNHSKHIIELSKYGKALIVEKPMALNVSDCEYILDIAKEKLFSPAFSEADFKRIKKAYIEGLEFETLISTDVVLDRARETAQVNNFDRLMQYGNYIIVKDYYEPDDVTPEDNWVEKKDLDDPDGDGFTGFVHQVVIDKFLSHHETPEDIELYFCGPPLMNQAVLKMADDWGMPEENVAFDDFGG